MSAGAKPVVRMKQWWIGPHFIYGDEVLYGIPENHPNPNGLVSNTKLITTSPVVEVNLERNEVETLNTLYQLVGPMVSQEHIEGLIVESANRRRNIH